MTNLKKITIEEIIENNYPEIVYENQYGTEVAVIKFDEDKLAEEIKQLISETIGEDTKLEDLSPYYGASEPEALQVLIENMLRERLRHAFNLKGE